MYHHQFLLILIFSLTQKNEIKWTWIIDYFHIQHHSLTHSSILLFYQSSVAFSREKCERLCLEEICIWDLIYYTCGAYIKSREDGWSFSYIFSALLEMTVTRGEKIYNTFMRTRERARAIDWRGKSECRV